LNYKKSKLFGGWYGCSTFSGMFHASVLFKKLQELPDVQNVIEVFNLERIPHQDKN
jgi:hypothetical protein